jgi:flagellin
MSMTVNNLNSLALLNILGQTANRQQDIMLKMSTGYKINRGADDPAGLLALKKLENELTAVDAGIAANQRTDAILGVADSALGEISSLLDDVERLALEAVNDAGLSAEEVAANQSQIDDALQSIDRIISNTQFNGKKLLDGSLSIRSTVSNAGAVTDVKVYGRSASGDDTELTVVLDQAASTAVLNDVFTSTSPSTATFSVQGKDGTAVIEINNGDDVDAIVAKINDATAQTGVSATNSSGLDLVSTDTGSDAFVRVSKISGDAVTVNAGYDEGRDAGVTVNGQSATVDGNTVYYSANGVSVVFENAMETAASTTKITVTANGGATFQLGTNSSTRSVLGLEGAYTDQLGTESDGYLASLKSGEDNSLVNDPSKAATVARKAKLQVAQLQGRIGGFQKFQVRTALNSLNDLKEGLETAQSVIRDVDYAQAQSELNRQNILMQSGMQLLGYANQQSAQVLALLR